MLMYYISSAATGVWMRQGLTLLPGCSGSAASGLVKKYRIDGGKNMKNMKKKVLKRYIFLYEHICFDII